MVDPFASHETDAIMGDVESTKYVYWQDKDQWLGYLQDYPDYWTQGESLEDLQSKSSRSVPRPDQWRNPRGAASLPS